LSSAVIYAGDVRAQGRGVCRSAGFRAGRQDSVRFPRHDRNAAKWLIYYIRRNGRPERVAMQLAVSRVDEENDQQGWHPRAHGVQRHASLQSGQLIATLESTGARMARINASRRSTRLSISSSSRPIARGYREGALADFAGGMLLTPTEIDKERGVIEEWRGGPGPIAPARPADLGPHYQSSTNAADREARDPEVVHARSAEGLYTKCTTDRMAVVASAMSILRRWRR
jgi:hypothetical protein